MPNVLMSTTPDQQPIAFERGEGVWLWDRENKKYLDGLSGLGVNCLGHCHPAITQTLITQANKLIHTSNTYQIPLQEELGYKLTQLCGMEQIIFTNCGTEANEVAIKLARLYAKKTHRFNPIIICMEKAFHGHTLASTSASGFDSVKNGFEPFLPTFISVPFNDSNILQQMILANSNIVGIFLESIQGDGGINIPSPGYLKTIRELCDRHNVLMILDEVQCGLGRTGKWFAFQNENIIPDILTLAKPLANGLPVGACLAKGKAASLLKPGQQASTFAGSPLICAVANAVLAEIQQKNILSHVTEIGEQIKKMLQKKLANHKNIIAIRGQGLMLGIELDKPCKEIMDLGMKYGLLFNVVSGNVIRLLPPYIISKTEAMELVDRLLLCINDFNSL